MGIAYSSSEEVPTHAHTGTASARDTQGCTCLGRFRPGRGGQEDAAIPPSSASQQVSGEGRGRPGHKVCVARTATRRVDLGELQCDT